MTDARPKVGERDQPRPRGPVIPADNRLPDVVSLIVIGALGALVALGVKGPARIVLALLFVTYVPGRAVVANWPSARARSAFALPMVLSLAIVALVSTVGLWLDGWYPTYQFIGEAALSAAAIATAFLRRR